MAKFAESPLEEEIEKHGMDGKLVGMVSLQDSLVLISHEKITIEKSLRLSFSTTNNEVKYEALLVGMTMVQKMGGKTVKIFLDSRLIIGQVKGELEARVGRTQEYLN